MQVLVKDEDRRGALVDRRFQLRRAGPVLVADLHQPAAGLADGEVIAHPPALVDDDLVLQPVAERQAGAFVLVQPGDAGRGAQHQPGRRPAGDIGRLVVRPFGDPAPGLFLQLIDLDEVLRGGLHRLQHLRRHQRPAQHGQRSHAR